MSVFMTPDKCLMVGMMCLGFRAFMWIPMPQNVRINTETVLKFLAVLSYMLNL